MVMGKGASMRGAFATIVAVLCFVVTGTASGEATCQMQELGELPVAVAGDVTVDAQVNGQPVKMVVDTGSAATLLTHPAAERLALALRPIPGVTMYGVGGGENGVSARIREFKVANLVARDFDRFVMGPRPLGAAQGILGAMFLMQTDVEFDFPDGKLRFFRPKNCKGDQVVYWGKAYAVAPMVGSNEGRIEVAVSLNGKTTAAQMDTGAASTVVTTAGAANAGVVVTQRQSSPGNTLNGLGARQIASSYGVFSTFALGDETIRNARLRVADLFRYNMAPELNSRIPTKSGFEINMLLGDDFFRSHRVYVSLAQRKVYVSYVGGSVFSAAGGSR
jgi:predicted aspartyl protease